MATVSRLARRPSARQRSGDEVDGVRVAGDDHRVGAVDRGDRHVAGEQRSDLRLGRPARPASRRRTGAPASTGPARRPAARRRAGTARRRRGRRRAHRWSGRAGSRGSTPQCFEEAVQGDFEGEERRLGELGPVQQCRFGGARVGEHDVEQWAVEVRGRGGPDLVERGGEDRARWRTGPGPRPARWLPWPVKRKASLPVAVAAPPITDGSGSPVATACRPPRRVAASAARTTARWSRAERVVARERARVTPAPASTSPVHAGREEPLRLLPQRPVRPSGQDVGQALRR